MAFVDDLKAPRSLTEAEVARLLAVTGEHKDGFRDHCIYAVALGTGLREHEIAALNVGDVLSTSGTAKRRVRLRTFKRSNDDPAAQEVVLPETLRWKLEKLYRVKRASGEGVGQDDPLFVSREGARISTRTIRWGFGEWQKRAGFDQRFTFHGLRHTACTNVYRASAGDIRVAQRFARHASVRSTQIYTHPSDEDVLRAVSKIAC